MYNKNLQIIDLSSNQIAEFFYHYLWKKTINVWKSFSIEMKDSIE